MFAAIGLIESHPAICRITLLLRPPGALRFSSPERLRATQMPCVRVTFNRESSLATALHLPVQQVAIGEREYPSRDLSDIMHHHAGHSKPQVVV